MAIIAASLALAGAAAADDLRPTPDYFAAAVFEMGMAEALGRACPRVSVDPVRAGSRATELLAALEADGFSTDVPHEQMLDPNAAIRDLQQAFVARYGLSEPTEARVCEVAETEIAEATGIGMLLVEVPE